MTRYKCIAHVWIFTPSFCNALVSSESLLLKISGIVFNTGILVHRVVCISVAYTSVVLKSVCRVQVEITMYIWLTKSISFY